MNCFDIGSCNSYLATRWETFAGLDIEDDDDSHHPYHFNELEVLGNYLLAPIGWTFAEHDSEKDPFWRIVLIVIGVSAAPIALVGALLKQLGERVNPNGHLRQDAFAKYEEMWNLAEQATPCPDYNTLFNAISLPIQYTNHIKSSYRITDVDLLEISLSLNPDWQPTDPDSDRSVRLINARQALEAWQAVHLRLIEKADAGQEYSKEAAAWRALAGADRELLTKVDNLLSCDVNILVFQLKLSKLQQEHGQIIAKMATVSF